jgi:hypothetical protein
MEMMKQKTILPTLSIFLFLISLNLISGIVVDSNYITIYPGEEGKVTIEIDNNENFDIEDVSIALELGGKKIFNEFGVIVGETEGLPFTVVGSSERDIDDIDEDDDDRVSFTLRASTDITPGDYNIPYMIKYANAEEDDETFEKSGSFGLRVSAKTEIDFAAEVNEDAIVGNEGKISLEIINKGLGNIKSVSIQIFPNGFELLSKDKIFIGTINADDTDIASFDVIYKTSNPTLSVKVDYKDFDNNDQIKTVNLPIKVYTKEEALKLGLIKKNQTGVYVGVSAGILLVWFVYRKIKKRRKNKVKS